MPGRNHNRSGRHKVRSRSVHHISPLTPHLKPVCSHNADPISGTPTWCSALFSSSHHKNFFPKPETNTELVAKHVKLWLQCLSPGAGSGVNSLLGSAEMMRGHHHQGSPTQASGGSEVSRNSAYTAIPAHLFLETPNPNHDKIDALFQGVEPIKQR
jgi:hypothetical protein